MQEKVIPAPQSLLPHIYYSRLFSPHLEIVGGAGRSDGGLSYRATGADAEAEAGRRRLRRRSLADGRGEADGAVVGLATEADIIALAGQMGGCTRGMT